MNLETIDTSTTAGKLRVMELACKGRQVAAARRGRHQIFEVVTAPNWNWEVCDFAIIAEPVGPEEVWVPVDGRNSISGSAYCEPGSAADHAFAMTSPGVAVRYIRADLAGEKS